MRDRLLDILITVALLAFVCGVAWFLYFLAGGIK
jgi:multisubunit Na+/H+ antiporter MnhF subunit